MAQTCETDWSGRDQRPTCPSPTTSLPYETMGRYSADLRRRRWQKRPQPRKSVPSTEGRRGTVDSYAREALRRERWPRKQERCDRGQKQAITSPIGADCPLTRGEIADSSHLETVRNIPLLQGEFRSRSNTRTYRRQRVMGSFNIAEKIKANFFVLVSAPRAARSFVDPEWDFRSAFACRSGTFAVL
ncbi:unnamed protein product [Scytosiphon promiscuus]